MDMQLTAHNAIHFTHYNLNSVIVNQVEYTTNIIVTNNEIQLLPVIDIEALKEQDLLNLMNPKPDIIIFGTGAKIIYPKLQLLQLLQKNGIGFEIMSIPALCRTHNFLVAEDRRIVSIIFFAKKG